MWVVESSDGKTKWLSSVSEKDGLLGRSMPGEFIRVARELPDFGYPFWFSEKDNVFEYFKTLDDVTKTISEIETKDPPPEQYCVIYKVSSGFSDDGDSMGTLDHVHVDNKVVSKVRSGEVPSGIR